MSQPVTVSRKEAAKRLSLGLRALDALLESGEIRSFWIGKSAFGGSLPGFRRLVEVESLRAYAERRCQEGSEAR